MGAADFLLSPALQQILKPVLAEPARPFAAADLAKLCKLDMPTVEQAIAQLLDNGVLLRGDAREGQPEAFCANAGFVFYPELRRIALKSFAAAEPLRAMLQAKFRGSVQRAFILGENPESGTLNLLLVYVETAPEREALDQALRKLLKSGALRQHVQADVVPERRFAALKRGDALHAQLAAETCVDISPTPPRKAKAPPAPAPMGLLQRARQRLSGQGRQGG
ncbi:hypothetical protein [Pseudorhodoferax sp. Leaf274]|uniref:hypothetical protein n=1 Tax=Pseudorhodoferax sp. Leaf274 TaxID=1736318 RepID=UPI000702EF96|nr:hypothetical protein [Pseudorhodoferax sp. Leaf274]KQP38965.1 hypothetical protein ASF44_11075 [Pseudorhodoferax sp. Leaf274]